jgi:soluble P-type ATPase
MPLEIVIPGFKTDRFPDGKIMLKHLVMDVNGTLALDGELVNGVLECLRSLEASFEIQLLTADTNKRQPQIDAQLQLRKPGKIHKDHARPDEPEHDWKAREVRDLGADSVVAIGNGRNDVGMLQVAALGIAVLNIEGLAREAQGAADLTAADPVSALELLFHKNRVIASLRR